MGTPMITLAMLKGACDEQRATFKKEWPQGEAATLANVRRAQDLRLDLEWGTKWFTPASLVAYKAGQAPLWETYEAGVAPLLATYEAGVASLWETYEAEVASLLETYKAGVASLWKTYEAGQAPLWLEAFLDSRAEAAS